MALSLETELASRLRLAVMRLARRLRRQGGGDLTPSQASALFSLERLGPMTLGELSATEGVRPPTLTKIVTALEEQGLVSREADSRDRRVAHVAVTQAGAALVARARSTTDAYLASRLSALPHEELAVLARAVEVLERLLETDE